MSVAEPLTVIVCTLNEEAVIERCIRSVQFADEVLVLDSGSTDGTRERASANGATVHRQEWLGFSAQKNRAAALASNDWVLSLDADEIVTSDLAGSIEQLLRGDPDPRDGYGVDRRGDFLGATLPNSARRSKRRLVRLYSRRQSHWDESMAVHEVVRPPGKVRALKGPLLHWNDFTLDELIRLFNRYATTEAEEIFRHGGRASALKVTGMPLLRFGWHYVVCGEMRLGARGLLHSALKAFSEFMRQAKLWELGREAPEAPSGAAVEQPQRGWTLAEKGGD